MSLEDDLKKRGGTPTAFDLLRSRRDWKTAQPKTAEEQRWYRVGYQMAPDREITDPVSPVVPQSARFFWALGLSDGLLKGDPRVPLSESPEGPAGSWWPFALAAGVASAALGVGLLLTSGEKDE